MTNTWWASPLALFNELQRMQQTAPHTPGMAREFAGVFPAVNIYDNGEAFMIRAELPGIDKATLDITTKHNQVSLRGQRLIAPPKEEFAFHRRERGTGTFHRVVTLPEPVDAAKTTASYKHGVLEIVCPRAESAKAHRIEIA